MDFDSYVVSDTKTAISLPLVCPLIHRRKGINLKRGAFTLAETLITLTIIGIIAAMTVPTLMSKYQKHTYVVGLKKAYSQLSQVVKFIPEAEGCSAGDFDCAFNATHPPDYHLANVFSKHFKVSKYCNSRDEEGCEWLSDRMLGAAASGFIIDDGMAYGLHRVFPHIIVDINGLKEPNKIGRDVFYFEVATGAHNNNFPAGTVLPIGSKLWDLYHYPDGDISTNYWRERNSCTSENVNPTCTARVLEEDAMNY